MPQVCQLDGEDVIVPDFDVADAGNGGKRCVFAVTLGGDRTLAAPVGARDGQFAVLRVVQDAAGGHALTFGAGFGFASPRSRPAPALDRTAGAAQEMVLVYASDPGEWRLVRGPDPILASSALAWPDWS